MQIWPISRRHTGHRSAWLEVCGLPSAVLILVLVPILLGFFVVFFKCLVCLVSHTNTGYTRWTLQGLSGRKAGNLKEVGLGWINGDRKDQGFGWGMIRGGGEQLF